VPVAFKRLCPSENRWMSHVGLLLLTGRKWKTAREEIRKKLAKILALRPALLFGGRKGGFPPLRGTIYL
jgi:hypothetical protein